MEAKSVRLLATIIRVKANVVCWWESILVPADASSIGRITVSIRIHEGCVSHLFANGLNLLAVKRKIQMIQPPSPQL
ncbi:hypothetical protein CA13_15840 [Planctomycetes bacterium CA13]|uniref:Uncharacterized protein n=1 Tax=Novipirellula herctigrandis TaxID=2527986 RepID=A0A5C5Z025_9BACT|nr:hypothetical protein CA13_15840 [Planctomycetes bacterium CA13]